MKVSVALVCLLLLSACAPVGSKLWCYSMKQTPPGDWSANDAMDFAKHCIL